MPDGAVIKGRQPIECTDNVHNLTKIDIKEDF
jgi:hypothetical protein